MSLRPRSTRRTRRRDVPPMLPTVARGLMALALVGGFVWLGVIAFNGVPFRGYTDVYASVPDVGNLLRHDPVRIAGVDVGQVISTSVGADGRPRVELQIDPGTKLPSDTGLLVRANGLLGARYVQLIPGRSARTLAQGSTIYGGANSLTFGIPQTLDTFDQQTRRALGEMTNGLGTGLLGRGGQLNEALALGSTGVIDVQQLVNAILGNPRAAQRLLPSLDSAVTPLAANRAQIAALPGAVSDALQPIVDKQSAVRQTLDQAPSALGSAEAGLASGDRLLAAVTGLASEAARTVPLAPAGLRSATALLRDSHGPLHKARTLLAAVAPAVPAALRITQSVSPLLAPLGAAVQNLTPMFLEISRYGCDVENFGAVMRSMDGFGGFGTGPIGWLGEFRAQASVVSLGGTLGYNDGTGLSRRDGYPPPCKYLSTTYPLEGG